MANSPQNRPPSETRLDLERVQAIESAAAIAFLSDAAQLQLLKPFLEAEITVSQVAAALDISVNAAYKLTQKLERLGLVGCVRAEKRAGKSLKFYRSSAPSYSISARLLNMDELFLARHGPFWERMQRIFSRIYFERHFESEPWMVVLDRSQRGQLFLSPYYQDGRQMNLIDDTQPAMMNGWVEFRLSKTQAKSLQRELSQLLGRYHRDQSGNDAYLLGIFLGSERDSPKAPTPGRSSSH